MEIGLDGGAEDGLGGGGAEGDGCQDRGGQGDQGQVTSNGGQERREERKGVDQRSHIV